MVTRPVTVQEMSNAAVSRDAELLSPGRDPSFEKSVGIGHDLESVGFVLFSYGFLGRN